VAKKLKKGSRITWTVRSWKSWFCSTIWQLFVVGPEWTRTHQCTLKDGWKVISQQFSVCFPIPFF
jgi:hypothetical protein